jgi:hypothetical protein
MLANIFSTYSEYLGGQEALNETMLHVTLPAVANAILSHYL